MASDFGREGIRVNAHSRRARSTPRCCRPAPTRSSNRFRCIAFGTTDEVAKIIYVLCTETSSYVNGAEIHINGGQHV